ncbi:hypothetical protein CCHR01_18863 [Colletotrichum chrysophilum]|uniref:Uncharacterized protein n=1 Tax=Colletotrichum chrysophilum TaxID=1836956 RepID=A0AAD9E7S2_9PEZI|nr:hypothetical protein CCHR01_18863 [Colletotrichum chrysophilum]
MILGLGIPPGGTRRVAATLVNGRHMPGLRPPELVRWHDSIAVIPRCGGFGQGFCQLKYRPITSYSHDNSRQCE